MALIRLPRCGAWHVGLLVYVVLVLTSSLLASPWVAAGLDFGHPHPEEEPAHVHDISGILTGAVTAALLTVALTPTQESRAAPKAVRYYVEGVLCKSRAIRAPPAS